VTAGGVEVSLERPGRSASAATAVSPCSLIRRRAIRARSGENPRVPCEGLAEPRQPAAGEVRRPGGLGAGIRLAPASAA